MTALAKTNNSAKPSAANALPRGDVSSSLIYGKVPPQAPELEAAVLGAVMLEADKLAEVLDIIPSPDCFYVDANQRIYAVIRSLADVGSPVDLLTVTEALRKAGDLELVGGAYYLTRLTFSVVSSAHVEAHARLVMEKYIMRELIRIGGQLVGAGYEETIDCFELLDQAEGAVMGLSAGVIGGGESVSAATMAREFGDELRELCNNPGTLTGVPTGFRDLDGLTGGWQNNHLIIIAARPAIGKTAFALNLVLNGATNAHPQTGRPTGAAIFSMEMTRQELVKRAVASLAGVPLTPITNGNVGDNQTYMTAVEDARLRFARLNIHVDDTAGLTMPQLRSKARRLKRKHDIGLIVVDYLQLMQGDVKRTGNREQEIAGITRDLKRLAGELSIPVIALSQLNRALESRGGSKTPQLSDLRESGAIEQDANVVMFLSPFEELSPGETPPAERRIQGHIAKNRSGREGVVSLLFKRNTQQWEEYDLLGEVDKPDNPRAGLSHLTGGAVPRGLNDAKTSNDGDAANW